MSVGELKPHYEIAVAIVERGEGTLVARRAEGQHLAGSWEFPGGKIEPGESPADAAVRESREELGIEVKPVELFETTEFEYDDRTVTLRFYRCVHLAGAPKPASGDAAKWVNREELANIDIPPANERVVGRLLSGG